METRMIALDCEATGLDFHHGARPYIVTTCRDDGTQETWQWDVDPETREVYAPEDDLFAIDDVLPGVYKGRVVGQNIKFDAHALASVYSPVYDGRWDWACVDDTLIAGHVLCSSPPHDLTALVRHYLREDIQKFEDRVEVAVKEARKICRKDYPTWAVARAGRADMPSAKEKTWKADMWLPRALRLLEHVGPPEWETVTLDYANADSAYTLLLWQVMRDELERRGLVAIYQETMRAAAVYWRLEQNGVTWSRARAAELRDKYVRRSADAERVMHEIAATCRVECPTCAGFARDCRACAGSGVTGYELRLPKGGRNKNLITFLFDVLRLPVVSKTQTGEPGLREADRVEWLLTLDPDTPAHRFVEALHAKGKVDKSVDMLATYERYGVPTDDADTAVVHAQVNPTAAKTLRGSSQNPNSQNISKRKDDEGSTLRYVFGPAPGREWWVFDYENIELRIPAFEAGEEDLMALFNRPHDPPFYGSEHLLNFSVVYPDVWAAELAAHSPTGVAAVIKGEKYDSTLYRRVKSGDFALAYGAGPATADRAFGRVGSHDRLKSKFAKKEALNQKYIEDARTLGYVETLPDKSVDPTRGYPIQLVTNEYGKISPTEPLNYHVQSTACWAKRRALVRCQAQLDEWRHGGFDAKILLDVHDELVFDFPLGGATNVRRARRLKQLMEQSGRDIGVPLSVSMKYCPKNYAESETPT